ncbi:DsbA family protein [Marinobacter caseinilyticus]|uniref:DsbA family protein n=1 Tax=Marinobacter caseinilyticus TaxID=2692195 RepID=UPI00140BDA2F|nr:DsbA family protein [Marinobacter caseinilyticus]
MTLRPAITLALSVSLTVVISIAATYGLIKAHINEEVETQVARYVEENPRIFFNATVAVARADAEAHSQLQQKQQSEALQLAANGSNLLIKGNPDGDVSIVMFSDYQCGYCKRSHAVLTELLEQDSGIKLIVKEFPVLGELSLTAARLAIAIHTIAPEKYPAFSDHALEANLSSVESLLDIASSLDISNGDLRIALTDPAIDQHITDNAALAEQLGVNGTPAFIVGNTLYPGALELPQLAALVEAQRGTVQ